MNRSCSSVRRYFAAAVAVFAFSSAMFLNAEQFRLKSTLTPWSIDWTSGDSYVNDAAPSDPSDSIVVPTGFTAVLDSGDTASWNLVSSLSEVLVSADAVFRVNVDTDSTLGCGVRLNAAATGLFEKTGDGKLTLTSADAAAAASSTYYDDYNVNIGVEGGILALPSNITGSQKVRYRTFSCAQGTSIQIQSANEISVYSGISGAGCITNLLSSTVKIVAGYIGHSVFSGKIGGAIRFDVNSTGSNG